MLALPDKQQIQHSFDQAAVRYDCFAQFQRQVAQRLARLLPQGQQALALDIGTGTGFGSTLLAARNWQPVGLDLSMAMLQQAAGRKLTHWRSVQADAEALPFLNNSFALIYSSLALQWCSDLAVPVAEAFRVLKPGGRFLCAVLLDGSLAELKRAWLCVDGHQHVNDFFTLNQVKLALAQKNIRPRRLICEPVVCHYPSVRALMRDLKGIGANQIAGRQRNMLTKGRLAALEGAYQAMYAVGDVLQVTYQVGLIEVIK